MGVEVAEGEASFAMMWFMAWLRWEHLDAIDVMSFVIEKMCDARLRVFS